MTSLVAQKRRKVVRHPYAFWVAGTEDTMLRFTILALLFLSVVQAQEKDYNTAEKMAALSDLGWLDTGEEAIKRYEYILPRLRSSCIDITTDSRAGDMLYVGHKYVKDSGASGEENLLKYTENAYQIVQSLESSYRRAKTPMKCAELFTLYTTARREGQSPEKAIKTVSEGISAVMQLLKK